MRSTPSNRHHQQTNTQLFTGRMPIPLPNQQCQSTEGILSTILVATIFNLSSITFLYINQKEEEED